MNTSFENLTIGTLATEAQVNVETIRFYQRKGLIQEPGRPQGSVRRYGMADLGRMRFIKSAFSALKLHLPAWLSVVVPQGETSTVR